MTKNEQLISDVQSTIDSAKSTVAKITNDINSNVDSAAESSKTMISEAVKMLEEKRSETEAKLQGLREATENASEDIVLGVRMAWEDLKETAESVASRF